MQPKWLYLYLLTFSLCAGVMAPAKSYAISWSSFTYLSSGNLGSYGGLHSGIFETANQTLAKGGGELDDDEIGQGAQNFIDNMAQRALNFLSDDKLSQDQKIERFENLLDDSFDMKTISRFSLGRYWRVASKPQRKEYFELFRRMVLDVYSKRFSDYTGQKFETKKYRKVGPHDFIVTAIVIDPEGDHPDVKVDWRVRYKENRYQVIDIIVEGVSMAVTQRSDFSSVIQRGGGNIQSLINHLKSKTQTEPL